MTVRRKLIAMCAAVVVIQLVSARAENRFSSNAIRHQARSIAAHEQLEQLAHIEAGLVRQLKELGDLIGPQWPGKPDDLSELVQARARVSAALRRHAGLLGQVQTDGAVLRDVSAIELQLAAETAALQAAINDVANLITQGPVDRERLAYLDAGFERTIGWLHELIASEREVVVAQDRAAARAARWAQTVGWAAPLLSALLLVAALALVLRSISRPLSDLSQGASRVAGGDLELPVPVRTRDELGRMAHAFNEMQRSLKARIAERDRALLDAHFRDVSEAAPIAIAEIDRAGRPVYTNRRWNELTAGDSSAEKAWTDLVHEDDRARATQLVPDGGAEELRLSCGGQTAWVVAQIAPFGAEAGGRSILALADITSQKQAIARADDMSRELTTVSHKAGMAEVSAGVLHNVGNVLNSIIVSAGALKEQIQSGRLARLVKAIEMLDQNRADLAGFLATERGKLVLPYMVQAAAQLTADLSASTDDLLRIERGTEHIQAIVATQQSYAKAPAQQEALRLSEVVEDVLRMNSASFERHEVRLVKRFEDDPALVTDRHKVMQVLINLVKNARHALAEAAVVEPVIEISIRRPSSDRVAVEVTDNGVGITAENLPRIFQHGFTTRATGHGFGLHSSALAARELGGAIRVVSPGTGLGASFILELPIAAEEKAA
jgi:signal transduction histidine kinase